MVKDELEYFEEEYRKEQEEDEELENEYAEQQTFDLYLMCNDQYYEIDYNCYE